MTRHVRALISGTLAALSIAACRAEDGAGPGGGGGMGGALGWNTGGGGTGPVSEVAGKKCAGRFGLPCSANEYCHFAAEKVCGEAEATGLCKLRPEVCTQDCPGVCGCDGQIYCNDCMANAAGMDDRPDLQDCAQSVTCEGATHWIANQAARGGMCTSVVRLDYQTRSIKSVRVSCAPEEAVTPVAARQTAEKDTGFGAEAQMISGLAPKDEYVFWEPPTDRGGVSAVSARSGITVFGGSIVMNGPGSVGYPASFLHPGTIGPGCGSSAPVPPAHGLNVETIEDLPAADVEAALSVVWTTALPDALATGAALLDAVVLLYPAQVGAVDLSAREWVVLLNSGPLQ